MSCAVRMADLRCSEARRWGGGRRGTAIGGDAGGGDVLEWMVAIVWILCIDANSERDIWLEWKRE